MCIRDRSKGVFASRGALNDLLVKASAEIHYNDKDRTDSSERHNNRDAWDDYLIAARNAGISYGVAMEDVLNGAEVIASNPTNYQEHIEREADQEMLK